MMLELLNCSQSDDSRCGPASIKAVLYYFGVDATESEIAARCNHTYDTGCTNEDMAEALRSYGLGASVQQDCTISDLAYWNRHRVPVIVDYFVSSDDGPNGHSSVVVDVDKHNVYLMDPEQGKVKKYTHTDFSRCWLDWAVDDRILPTTKLDLGVIIIPYPQKISLFT